MNARQIKASAAFQAGCRHRLAGRALPPVSEMRAEWGFSALEAEQFEGGYELTRLTQDTIAGGAAAVTAERELWDMLSDGTSLFEARERLGPLIALRCQIDNRACRGDAVGGQQPIRE